MKVREISDYQTVIQRVRDGSFRLRVRKGEVFSPIVVVDMDRISSANVGNPLRNKRVMDL